MNGPNICKYHYDQLHPRLHRRSISISSSSSSSSSLNEEPKIDFDQLFFPLNPHIVNGKKRKRDDYNYYDEYTNEFFFHLFNDCVDESNPQIILQYASDYYKININTLLSKYRTWKNNGKGKIGTMDRRGRNRKLSIDEENQTRKSLVHRINTGTVTQSRHAINIIHTINPSIDISSSLISRLKKNLGITSRLTKLIRRQKFSSSEKENEAYDILFGFLEDVNDCSIRYGINRLYNYDESPLPTAPSSIVSMQLSGKESVPISTNGKVERVYSIGATVSAAGDKLPLLIIKKGIKENCQSVIELKEVADDHYSDLILTKKGWINEKSFLYYLESVFYPNVITPCALIIDVYAAHRTDAVIAKAKELNIHLLFVPACHTSELQPLDYGVFGPLKNICKKNYDPLTHPLEYVDCFQSSFYNFDPLIIQKAFKESLALDNSVFDPEVIHHCQLIDSAVKSVLETGIDIDH